ncbi:hypothetical protein N9L68_04625 [bacterium]|nr:hypothetical protein [bacterium]
MRASSGSRRGKRDAAVGMGIYEARPARGAGACLRKYTNAQLEGSGMHMSSSM